MSMQADLHTESASNSDDHLVPCFPGHSVLVSGPTRKEWWRVYLSAGMQYTLYNIHVVYNAVHVVNMLYI